MGKFVDAVETLQRAVREFPDDASARAALADAYLAMGDLDRAITEAEKRVALSPTIDARLDLAALYARKRVAAKAEPLFKGVLQEAPDNLAATVGLADLYLSMGNWQAAERFSPRRRRSARRTPPSSPGWASSTHARAGRTWHCPSWRHSCAATRRSSRPRPSSASSTSAVATRRRRPRCCAPCSPPTRASPTGCSTWGWCSTSSGQPGKAEESFKAAIQADPAAAAPHYSLGELYEAQGKKKEALAEYRGPSSRRPTWRPPSRR